VARRTVALCDERLWRVSVDAQPVALTETGAVFALDPARQRAAYVDHLGHLQVLELASGAVQPVIGDFTRSEVCGWLITPNAVVVRTTTTPLLLDCVDLASGARTRHLERQPPQLGLKAVDALALYAGGERYAYCYGQELSQLVLVSLRV
jgi:hypothetical protein